jgi:hypothetical protein
LQTLRGRTGSLQPCGDPFDSFYRPAGCFEDDARFERSIHAIA